MKICIMTMNTDDGFHPIAFARRAEEMRNHGVAADKRFRILGERIRAIKSIWAEEEAEFHGEFVVFDPISSWPKPVQQAHPPILIGGWARSPLDRVLACGDGWFPGAAVPPGQLEPCWRSCPAAL
jgi:alkanesulfonate monooxygenase SsuD/methylene tetrahydromethanopterin reductase-like flavin-dependent oxidoreductase (luciferase family)